MWSLCLVGIDSMSYLMWQNQCEIYVYIWILEVWDAWSLGDTFIMWHFLITLRYLSICEYLMYWVHSWSSCKWSMNFFVNIRSSHVSTKLAQLQFSNWLLLRICSNKQKKIGDTMAHVNIATSNYVIAFPLYEVHCGVFNMKHLWHFKIMKVLVVFVLMYFVFSIYEHDDTLWFVMQAILWRSTHSW